MKIVIYTHYLKGGGAEKRATTYANYLFDSGIDVHVVTIYPTESEYTINNKIKRSFIASNKTEYDKLSIAKKTKRLREILTNIKPDVVVSFLTTYGLYTVFARRHCKELKNTKLVYCVTVYQRKYSLKHRIVDFLCCLHSDRISLQCYEQIKCNRLFKRKCIVNFNPVADKWDVYKRNYSSLSIISVGRLTKQKRFDITIKAVCRAHAINSNISLDIFGDGPLKNKLNKLIKKYKAEKYIKLIGFSFELPKELEKHNMMISSSGFEGFPNGLAEGMLAGLVCLSTPCPTGPKEIIENNVNGILFKNKKELTSSIIRLINNPLLCENLGIEARKSCLKRFEASVVLPKFLKDLSKL